MSYSGYNMEISDITSTYNNNNYDNVYPVNKCKVSLKNDALWKKFHNLDTEMIITKSGRRMFPSLQAQVTEIDPQALYCIFLEMIPASRCRYKYSSAGGWAPAGSEEAQSPHRLYVHPESPAKGEYWMSQPISFGRLKLTNMPAPPAGQIVLSSMHKYQPRIIIAQTSDPRAISWSPSTCVAFPETQFIAVTAYQNEAITQLKIDNNPFAKGFRQNGQAKCKRKRTHAEETEEDDELICVTDEHDSDENSSLSNNDSSVSIKSAETAGIQNSSPAYTLPSEEEKLSVNRRSHSSSTQESPSVKCAKIEDSTDVSSRGDSLVKDSRTVGIIPVISAESLRNPFYHYSTGPQLYLPPSTYFHHFSAAYLPTSYNTTYHYPYGTCYERKVDETSIKLVAYPKKVIKEVTPKKPRKLTDFSIKALLGC